MVGSIMLGMNMMDIRMRRKYFVVLGLLLGMIIRCPFRFIVGRGVVGGCKCVRSFDLGFGFRLFGVKWGVGSG